MKLKEIEQQFQGDCINIRTDRGPPGVITGGENPFKRGRSPQFTYSNM